MSKSATVEALQQRRAELLAEAKRLAKAITIGKQREREKRARAVLNALESEGLLDADPAAIRAALASIKPTPAGTVGAAPESTESE